MDRYDPGHGRRTRPARRRRTRGSCRDLPASTGRRRRPPTAASSLISDRLVDQPDDRLEDVILAQLAARRTPPRPRRRRSSPAKTYSRAQSPRRLWCTGRKLQRMASRSVRWRPSPTSPPPVRQLWVKQRLRSSRSPRASGRAQLDGGKFDRERHAVEPPEPITSARFSSVSPREPGTAGAGPPCGTVGRHLLLVGVP